MPSYERIGNEVPPDGWQYVDGEDTFRNDNIISLAKIVDDYRAANGSKKLPDTTQAIIEYTAVMLDKSVRDRYFRLRSETVKPTAAPTLLEGAKLLIGLEKDRALGSFALVGLQRAYQRATICAACPHNSAVANKRVERPLLARLGATRVRQLRQEAQKRGKIPPLPKTKDDKLGVCLVCSCSLKDAVWFSPETHKEFVQNHGSKLPVACWKRQENEVLAEKLTAIELPPSSESSAAASDLQASGAAPEPLEELIALTEPPAEPKPKKTRGPKSEPVAPLPEPPAAPKSEPEPAPHIGEEGAHIDENPFA